MSIDTILETVTNFINEVKLTGTVTLVAGANTLVGVGTLFTTELTVGKTIAVIDDNGEAMYYTVATIGDNLNATIAGTAKAAATGVSLYLEDMKTPFFVGADPITAALFPTKVLIYDKARNDLVTGQYANSLTPDKWIDANEGVLLKSVYAVLPYQYTFADSNIALLISYHRYNLAAYAPITTVGNSGYYFLPIENSEVAVNEYIASPIALGLFPSTDLYWGLSIEFGFAPSYQGSLIPVSTPNYGSKAAWVSIANEPTAMDRKLLPVKLGVRIQHGLPMVGV